MSALGPSLPNRNVSGTSWAKAEKLQRQRITHTRQVKRLIFNASSETLRTEE